MLSGVKEWRRSAGSVGKAFLGSRGFLQMPVSSLPYPLTTPKPVIDTRKLFSAERNYDVGNRDLLAIKLALEEWHHWLEGAYIPFLS
jgi:hypothetical protein